PLQVLEQMGEWIGLFGVRGLGQQLNDNLGVGGGLEDMAKLFVLAAKQAGVDQVAVVGDGDGAEAILAQQGLGIAELAAAGGGIADMADGCMARQLLIQKPSAKDL